MTSMFIFARLVLRLAARVHDYMAKLRAINIDGRPGRYDIRDGSQSAWDMYHRLGPIVAEQLPGRNMLVRLFSAEDVRTLYREEGRMPHHVGSLPLKLYHRKLTPEFFANDGLLHAQGEEWRRIRSQAYSSVSDPRSIQAYSEDLVRIADDAVSLIASLRDDKGEVKDCYDIMRRWAFESVIFLTVNKRMGVLDSHLNPQSQEASLMSAINDMFSMLNTLTTKFPFYRYYPTPLFSRFLRRTDDLLRYIFAMVLGAAQEAAREDSSQRNTILANLHRMGNMNQKEIFTFVADTVAAGSETTAAAATFCLYCLAMNPVAQEKARKEVFSAISEEKPRRCTQLQYIKACIKETLRLGNRQISLMLQTTMMEQPHELPSFEAIKRAIENRRINNLLRSTCAHAVEAVIQSQVYCLTAQCYLLNRFYPVVPAVHRKLDHDVVMSGYVIPKNTVLRSELFVSGRLEENFTRASEFQPERWIRTGRQDSEQWRGHPFASLPFSSGPRMCIGRRIAEAELSALIAQVLLNYRVENWHGDIGFQSQLTGRPKRPAMFRFTQLDDAERLLLNCADGNQ